MITLTRHITFIIILLWSIQIAAQNNMKGYRIEGDEVIFVFNKSDYEKVSLDGFKSKKKFKNLTIENVVVSGEFNNWSKEHWNMIKINEDTYELRKKLIHFTDEFSWEFKFVINNEYWAEPTKKDPNIETAVKDGYNLNVYNLKLYTSAYPDKNGNVRFRLKGYENAEKVVVSGSFNKWSHHLFEMYKIDKGWELILKLKPDEYEYRFIVDGRWMEDPTNPDRVINEFGEYNSHIDVKKLVEFKLDDFNNAKNVILTGSFNNWNEKEYQMQKTEHGKWIFSLPLSGGKYHYKFIVDGKWIEDPVNKVKEYDDKGNINSVCMVK